MNEYRIEKREAGLPRFRVVSVDEDGKRRIIGTFWTLNGCHRWIKSCSWTSVRTR